MNRVVPGPMTGMKNGIPANDPREESDETVPGPEDDRRAENRPVQIGIADGLLPRGLGAPVFGRRVLRGPHRAHVQKAPDSRRARRPEDVLHRLPMHPVEGLLPLLGDDPDQMNDRFAPGERSREIPAIEHVSHRDLHRPVVAVVRPRRLPRQHGHGMPAPQERVDDVGSDEPGPAGHQNLQFESPLAIQYHGGDSRLGDLGDRVMGEGPGTITRWLDRPITRFLQG